MRYFHNIKNFNFVIPLYQLFTLSLLLLEIFTYPGVVQNYTHISIIGYLFVSVILVFVRDNRYSKIFEKIILFSLFFLSPLLIYLSYQEHIHFPNFVYSQYHISLLSLKNLLVFFIAQSASSITNIKPIFGKSILKYRSLILLLFSVFFSLFLIGNNINAKWSIIDDHEIANFLGSDKKIFLKEIPNIVLNTEVGSFGSSLRYRPTYYLTRVSEALLWKDSPQLWYFARYVILVTFIFSISYIVSNYFGIIPAVIFSLFVMTSAYWPDIWTRLGPAEIYVVFGVSLYILGLYKILEEKTKSLLPWIMMLTGGLMAIGSKENMVILAVPNLYLVCERIAHHKANWKLIFPILQIIFAMFVSVSIYLAISKVGHDVYANEITTGGKLALLLPGINKTVRDLKIIEIIVITITLLVSKIIILNKHPLKETFSKNKNAILLIIFFCFTYLIQYLFYSGAWPTNMRYDFPGVLAKQLFWLTSIYLISKLMSKHKLSMLNYVFSGILLISIISTGYYQLINGSKNNVSATNSFTDSLSSISDTAKNHPDYPLVLKSENLWDYEPIFSIERFIIFMGVTNPIYLNYSDMNIANRHGLEKQLSEELTHISKNGKPGIGSYNSKSIGTKCISILISGVKDNNECVLSGRIN